MTEKKLTCVVCPTGCALTVQIDDEGKITSISGNTCARGKTYVESEITNPVRTLTSTVLVKLDSKNIMLPVKTTRPIPRDSLFMAMDIIRKTVITYPPKAGESIIIDFINRGTNLIACKDAE